ncbi:hypothetical protein AW736_07605 [Termitidicoccus mucosus]|uniref:Ig-like domain-containing protein n=2 Tax=Termitidicoccus mucosus TaxID=1184151 RepID=A0A178IKU7_9BACT|nr:hypothetical protein AW736_07605 [Opitutaceae bacterium TSB47]
MAAPGARALPVFPGAEGFGTETVAGRGSAGAPAIIYTVTSLADSDPTVEGEFRYGVETLSGPRVIVFAVSGVIELKKVIRVRNTRPYLTIAGQTAPYPGITIKNSGLDIQTHDILVQHIAIRPGARPKAASGEWSGLLGYSSRKCILLNAVAGVPDANACYNIVFDHVSTSWGTDENITLSGKALSDTGKNTVNDVTFSNSLNYEALRFCGKEGPVSEGAYEGHPDVYDTVDGNVVRVKNASINGIDGHSAGFYVYEKSKNVSLVCNILAYNRWRNPLMAAGGKDTRIINNLIFAPGESSGHRINVGNLYPYGAESATYDFKASADGNVVILHEDPTQFPTWSPANEKYGANATQALQVESTAAVNTQLFLNNNRLWHPTYEGNWVPYADPFNATLVTQKRAVTPLATDPFTIDGVTLSPPGWTPAQLEAELLAKSGARPLVRDLHDKRLIKQIRERRLRDWTDLPSQSITENWSGDIDLGELDADGYQTTQGSHDLIFPSDPQGDSDGDGYTNFEEWLHAWSAFVEAVPGAPLSDAVPSVNDFENGDPGNWIASGTGAWSVATLGTSGAPGYNKVYSQTDTTGDARAILENTNWAYQTVQADVTLASFDGAGYDCGILGRCRDSDNHYSLVLRDGNLLELRRVAGGITTVLASTSYTVTAGATHRLALTLDGPQLIATASVWDAGSSAWSAPVRITGFDYSPIANGNAGIATHRAAAQFDNVFASDAIAAAHPPVAPTAAAATSITTSGFTANWGFVAGATAYRLDVSTDSSFATFISGGEDILVGASLSHAVTGLAPAVTYYYRVRAVGPGGASDSSVAASVTTQPLPTAPPGITSALAATGTVGSAFSYQVTATNTPDSYAATGLPSGLGINPATGFISGTPATDGASDVTLTASNAVGVSAPVTLAISIAPYVPPVVPPVIGGNLTAAAVQGMPFSYAISASNNPSGYGATALPPGLSFDPAAGIINGVPTASGNYTVALTATNAGGTGNASLTIIIAPPPPPSATPVINCSASVAAAVDEAFSFQVTATNDPASYSAAGLPAGLAINSATGHISGHPAFVGVSTVTLAASNSAGTGTAQLLIAIEGKVGLVTLAGTATVSGTANGNGLAAQFNAPEGAAASDKAGNLYVADTASHTIRRIAPDGTVTTYAGQPGVPGAVNGAAAARFNSPSSIVIDADGATLYVADTGNQVIRKIDIPTAEVSILAGLPNDAGSTDGAHFAARFDTPSGLALDADGNLYVADTGNSTIRKIVIATGAVTTLAGSPGAPGSSDGPLVSARFDMPTGLAIDTAAAHLHIADTGNSTIRRLILSTGVVETLAGVPGQTGMADGTRANARFNTPQALATDAAGNLYVADTGNDILRKIEPATRAVTTIIGIAGQPGSQDGIGPQAAVNAPAGMTADAAGNIYVLDTGNHTVRALQASPAIITHPADRTVSSGAATTLAVVAAGSPVLSYQWHKNGLPIVNATSATLGIAPATATDAASYTVVVSNQMGAVQSLPAVLTVGDSSGGDTLPGHATNTGGGGGAPGWLHLLGLTLLLALRRATGN